MSNGTTASDLKWDHIARKPAAFVVKVTPVEAEHILNHFNPSNRPLKEGVAENYGREMKAGRWTLTNQGIGFSKTGVLLDGQHRLWGCVESETPFDTMVMVGLDEDAREVIDVGLRRTEADIMKLRTGHKVSVSFVGVGRLMMGKGRRGEAPRQDILDFLERHAKAISFATTAVQSVRLVTIGPVLAAVARAYYTCNHEELLRFLRILSSGIPEGNAWGSVLLLRKWLLAQKGGKSDEKRYETYAKTETALKYFLDGKPTTRLYASSEELFPLSNR